MPRGSKSSYTDKQDRQADHIKEGYEKKGVSKGEAERRAWATVNKQDGGGKRSGSGRGEAKDSSSSAKGGRKAAESRKAGARRSSAKKSGGTMSTRSKRSTGGRKRMSR
jgi:plasmid stabilization system protein ParE